MGGHISANKQRLKMSHLFDACLICASATKQYNLVLDKGQLYSVARKAAASMVESNGFVTVT